MYRREQYHTLMERMAEPRKFIQVIAGPRQVGKSTLVKQVMQDCSLPYTLETADAIDPENGEWIANVWESVRQQMSFRQQTEHLLVIDEIHELNYGKGSALCHIMEKGRGNGISLISILQAPHELKPKQLSILNQASVKLIFGLNDGDDARACAEKIGVKPYYRFMEVFGEMPKRNCLVVGALEDSDGELRPKRFSKVQIPNLSKKI